MCRIKNHKKGGVKMSKIYCKKINEDNNNYKIIEKLIEEIK